MWVESMYNVISNCPNGQQISNCLSHPSERGDSLPKKHSTGKSSVV